jgi:hypothetical protein
MIDRDLEDLRAFADAAGPSPAARERIRRRVAGAAPARRRWPVVPIGVAAIAAAAVAWIVASGDGDGARDIGPTGRWERLTRDVAVYAAGHGRWDGALRWDDGEVRVSVAPDRGVHLRIVTPEAVVEVVGTVFTVARDEIGTAVSVSKGRVSVTCTAEAAALLDPGGSRTCYRSADAGLGHVLQLEADGAAADRWLPEVSRALAHPEGTAPARLALEAMAIDGLLLSDRLDEAAAAATALVARGEAALEPDPVGAVAAALLDRDGCAPARPLLEALVAAGDGVAAVRLADCTPDPSAKRRVLEVALADPRPDVRAAAAARLPEVP